MISDNLPDATSVYDDDAPWNEKPKPDWLDRYESIDTSLAPEPESVEQAICDIKRLIVELENEIDNIVD